MKTNILAAVIALAASALVISCEKEPKVFGPLIGEPLGTEVQRLYNAAPAGNYLNGSKIHIDGHNCFVSDNSALFVDMGEVARLGDIADMDACVRIDEKMNPSATVVPGHGYIAVDNGPGSAGSARMYIFPSGRRAFQNAYYKIYADSWITDDAGVIGGALVRYLRCEVDDYGLSAYRGGLLGTVSHDAGAALTITLDKEPQGDVEWANAVEGGWSTFEVSCSGRDVTFALVEAKGFDANTLYFEGGGNLRIGNYYCFVQILIE